MTYWIALGLICIKRANQLFILTVSVAVVRFTDTQVNKHRVSCFISNAIIHGAAHKSEPADVGRALLDQWYAFEKKRLHATSWLIMITYPPTLSWLHNVSIKNLRFPPAQSNFLS